MSPGGRPFVPAAGLAFVLLLATVTPAFAEALLSVSWEEAGTCVLTVSLSEGSVANPQGVWVVTLKADRYGDGIFAWQLHWSPEQANVIVLPNDFLTSRAFSLEQLGVLVEAGTEVWMLRIPRHGTIPELVAPGDILRVHALWIQQEPLGSLLVPEEVLAASATAGAGASLSHPPVTVPAVEDSAEEPSASPLPTQTAYFIGEPILHRFVPLDPETGLARVGAHATATLLRIDKDKPPDLLLYRTLYPGEDGVLELRIETAELAPGTYELYVWMSGDAQAHSTRLELMQPDP